MDVCRSNSEQEAGFITFELLVALLVLSISLGIAVQTISQARISLLRKESAARADRILRQVIAEQLPDLSKEVAASPISRTTSEWKVELLREENKNQSVVRVRIWIAPAGDGHYTSDYLTFLNTQGEVAR